MSSPHDSVGRTRRRTEWIDARSIDRMADLLDRPHGCAAGVVPVPWHWMYFFNESVPGNRVGPDGHPLRGDFLPQVALPRRMFAGSEIRAKYILRPCVVLPASISLIAGLAAASFFKYAIDWSYVASLLSAPGLKPNTDSGAGTTPASARSITWLARASTSTTDAALRMALPGRVSAGQAGGEILSQTRAPACGPPYQPPNRGHLAVTSVDPRTTRYSSCCAAVAHAWFGRILRRAPIGYEPQSIGAPSRLERMPCSWLAPACGCIWDPEG